MLKAERQDRIVEMCRVRGTVSVHEIATTLGVSDMTVRRDLEELSDEGRIERLRGGAKTSEGVRDRALIRESAHLERQLLHIEEKTKIAKVAASLVSEGDTIFLGSSTTVELAAQFLPVIPLRIVTNSLPIFNLFVDGDIREIIMLGGTYRPRSGTFMGPSPRTRSPRSALTRPSSASTPCATAGSSRARSTPAGSTAPSSTTPRSASCSPTAARSARAGSTPSSRSGPRTP